MQTGWRVTVTTKDRTVDHVCETYYIGEFFLELRYKSGSTLFISLSLIEEIYTEPVRG